MFHLKCILCVFIFSTPPHLSLNFVLPFKDYQNAYKVLSHFADDLPIQSSLPGFNSHSLCIFPPCCILCGRVALVNSHDVNYLFSLPQVPA